MPDAPDNFEASRADKLRRIAELGIDPWGGRFDGYQPIAALRELPLDEANPPRVTRFLAKIVHFPELIHFVSV